MQASAMATFACVTASTNLMWTADPCSLDAAIHTRSYLKSFVTSSQANGAVSAGMMP